MPRNKKELKIDMRYISPEPTRKGFIVTLPYFAGHRPRTRFKHLEDAITFRDLAIAKISKNQLAADPNMTVFQWFQIYQNEYCSHLAEKTRQNNWSLFKNHCQSLFKLKMVGGIKKYHITNIIIEMLNNGYAKDSIKRTYAFLSAGFHFVNNQEIIVYDNLPIGKFALPDNHGICVKPIRNNRPRKAYPITILNNLVSVTQSYSKNRAFYERWVSIIKLLRLTGMRISECLGICKKDIEIFDDNILIHLNQGVHDVNKKQNAENKCWSVGKLKCAAAYRTLTITDNELINLIKILYNKPDKPVKYKGKNYVFLFATRTGTPILHSNFSETFDKIKAKITTDIRPYEIRHSIATFLAADKDMAFADAAAFLGHTLEVFMGSYVHPDPSKTTAISSKITLSQQNLSSHFVKEKPELYLINHHFAPTFVPNTHLITAN